MVVARKCGRLLSHLSPGTRHPKVGLGALITLALSSKCLARSNKSGRVAAAPPGLLSTAACRLALLVPAAVPPSWLELRMLSLAAAIVALVAYYSIQFNHLAVEPARAHITERAR
jgi:hypothetical protein